MNTLGHSAGVLIFGIFLYLLMTDRVGSRLHGHRIAVATAAVAFIWDLSSLIALAFADPTTAAARVWIAISSSALSLLPALLLDVSLSRRFRSVVGMGYLLSSISIAMHALEMPLRAPQLHQPGQLVITSGFGILTIAVAVWVLLSGEVSRRQVASRLAGTIGLFLFAMSFVHFGAGDSSSLWPIELLSHHAGLPLALFVLLQDYRSVLVDAMIRFLANILLAGLFVAGVTVLHDRLPPAHDQFQEGLILVGAAIALVLFAVVRNAFQRFLTRILFQRPELETVLERLRSRHADFEDEQEYLSWAGGLTAEFMTAEGVGKVSPEILTRLIREGVVMPGTAASLDAMRDELERAGVEVVIPILLSKAETRFLFLGRRAGGRRYLSEDLELLAHLAARIAEQVVGMRESELKRLVAQAELRALQSQIHPHFLFNALNTLYGTIPREAVGARRTVLNLADIFRYFLQTDRTYIALEEELRIVQAYLEIESLRLGPKLRIEISVSPEVMGVRIPVLSIQPLVENAVKHGVAAKAEGGLVRLEADLEDGKLRVRVSDSGAGFMAGDGKGRGVGLDNVRQRLRLCYGPDADLKIDSSDAGARVQFAVGLNK
jgi:two-component system LytT family sensor kinase